MCLDVLDYSESYDTNISKFFFPRKHSFLSEEAKIEKIDSYQRVNIRIGKFASSAEYRMGNN